MADDKDKEAAYRALLGKEKPVEKPDRIYERTVRHTPMGTETNTRITKEGSEYLSFLQRERAQIEKTKESLSKAPVADKEKIQKDLMARYTKKKDKDKGDDFER